MFQNNVFGGSAFGNSGATSFGSKDTSMFSSGGPGTVNLTDATFSNSNRGGLRGGAVGDRFSSNGYSSNNQLGGTIHNQVVTFDPSGNVINNTSSLHGGGRGRGSNYKGGGRGSANRTYIAPGLSGGQQYQAHAQQHQQLRSTGSLPGEDKGSGYMSPAGAGRGHEGYSPRGRGGRGGTLSNTGGVPGQFRSLQWRPDGTQHHPTHQASSQLMDSVVSTTQSIPMQDVFTSAFGPNGQSQQQPFSTFSVPGQSMNMQLRGAAGAPVAIGGGQGHWQATSMETGIQSSFAGEVSMSAFPPALHGPSLLGPGISGLGGDSTASGKQGSVFAVPVGQDTKPSNGSHSGAPLAFMTQSRPLPTIKDNAGTQLDNTEDADSRLTRFTAVPIGNKYEELKENRAKKREEAIKQGAIADPNHRRGLEHAITLVGICMDMCPEFERHEREYQQSLEKFEKIPGTESVDHTRAVKAYSRPAAGVDQPLPSDVRPPRVLLTTLDYLITEIVGQGDLADSHAFVRDRTRSIRQDFTLQNSRGIEAVKAHEIIARYHILCMHQLCENRNFSLAQEVEQLWNVLTSLQEFYDDLRVEGVHCPNEAEFRAYHLLSHLNDPDMIRQAQSLPQHILQDPYIQVAVEVHALTRRNNNVRRRAKIQSEASPNYFSRFFKLIESPKITYLMACLLENGFGGIRKGALKALNKSYLELHEGFPVRDLVSILGFDNAEECIANCQEYDLELTNHGQPAVVFGRKEPVSRRRIFREGTTAIHQHRNVRIVEAKRQNYTTVQIIRSEISGPQQSQTEIAQSFSSVSAMTSGRVQWPQGSVSRNVVSGSIAAITTGTGAWATRSITTTDSKPTAMFNFGLNRHSVSTSISTTSALPSSGGSGLGTSGSALGSRSPSTPALSISSVTKPPTRNDMSIPPTLHSTAPVFKPLGPAAGLTFNTPSRGDTPMVTGLMSATSMPPPFTFKTPPAAIALPGAPAGATQLPSLPTESTLTTMLPISSTSTSTSTPTPRVSTALPKPLVLPSASLPSPAAPATPRSDATRIVTKRGRIYPRAIVESVMMDILERETNRLIRSTAAQMLQEVMKERSVRRAKERQEVIRQESMLIMSILVAQFTDQVVTDIVVDIHRETWLQRKVITRWKEYTRKCRQRAEELRRRQEHFLVNVRAMDSYAGLKDGNPVALKIQEYRAQQQRINRTHDSVGVNGYDLTKDAEGLKAMVAVVSNKRKRLLSIGQEGSPDMALVAGLKKVAEPKRELWAPLPVLDIVQSSYRRPAGCPLQIQQKRNWRLFVRTSTFKDMTSKWLLTKLGIDMGRHTKSQLWFGTLISVHQKPLMEENPTEVVVHGSEDQSMKDLLGMPRYSVMEAAAFMFEFSKMPFASHDVSDEAIRLYWIEERDRLVRFLACFPKVKQPIVFIMWSSGSGVWERVSPYMVEYLELDKMVGSPHGPLLSYRFLNLDMTSMKLDPYIVGSLEWLASETKDVVEDLNAMLMNLLDKYRPIYDWALCRISLAEGPLYSQYDEDDEEETHMWRMKTRQRKQSLVVDGSRGTPMNAQQQDQVRNMFVDITESGFNMAVRLFNMELESIAQTIEMKGQGETREGADREGKVKDAMAYFIRQAELPEMKPGAIQDRLNFGMDPKSALCDFIDVYIATLGGLAKEQQNWDAKAVMRTTVWQMLISSKDDRVPLEAVFKQISSQILKWVTTGILDKERFSVRIHTRTRKRELAQHCQQGQYQSQRQEDEREDGDIEQKETIQQEVTSEQAFAPLLIHDEVDVEGIVFDYEITVQSEVRAWEKSVERQARDREECALAVPNGNKLVTATLLRIGDGRKRRAPERRRDMLKRSRLEHASSKDKTEGSDNLFLTHPSGDVSPKTPSTQSLSTPLTVEPVSAPTSTKDRLARLRNLINEVKAGTLHQ